MKITKHRLLPLLLAGSALLLLLLYFALVRPLTAAPEETKPPVTTGEGEGVHLGKYNTLYPYIPREEMISITVHNEHGTYRFARVAKEGEEVKNTDAFVIFKEKDGEFLSYPGIEYDEERLSELVVATGTFYYLPDLGRAPELGDGTLDFAQYGLSEADDPAWFEITTFGGEPIKVYVGDPAVTDNGYYVRVDGRDTVYVSNSNLVGETALSRLASFVNPMLTGTLVNNGYYYSNDFRLYKPSYEGQTVGREDTVYFLFREVVDGVTGEAELGSVDLATARAEIVSAFCDTPRTTASAPFSYTLTFAADDKEAPEELRGKTVTYHVDRIERIQSLYIALDFLNSSDRSKFDKGTAYKITAPETKLAYTPSSNHYMGILETLGFLSGVETVEIGLDVEAMDEYGLYAYHIVYDTPLVLKTDKDRPGDVVIKDSDYMSIDLYISEKKQDENGGYYYYVGSVMTNIVARVDAETLAFLERPNSWWLNDTMYNVNINDVSKMEFSFDYTDAKESYAFRLESAANKNGEYSVSSVTLLADGRTLSLEAFRDLYTHLVTIYYSEEYDGDVPKDEVLAGRAVLTLRVTLSDDEVYVYRFHPYSARHVLVSVAKEGSAEGAFFYILAPEVEKIYSDIGKLLRGEAIDPDREY
ncbi:MAG: hypothetical protein J6V07_01080 [Clostridia bacterium]|nr:hypothetical protein [Clostridia bacterium]